jgi:2',3'-cyclic-nucleotide 2'-phosphodiesterase / 3'-nucleotidase
MTFSKYLFAFVLVFISFLVDGQQIRIKIIETSDVHGAIFPFDFVRKEKASGSLSQVQSYVSEQRNRRDQKVILIDNGDMLQGDPSVYFYNSPDSVINLYAEVMNFMDYDLAVVGNHDIEQGPLCFNKFAEEIAFPWLAANAITVETGEPYFKAYHSMTVDEVKITFLGMVTPAIPSWIHPSLFKGIFFEDMIKSAEYWMKIIRENERPDIVIGVFHAGVDYTYNGEDASTPFNENAAELVAKAVAGFDVVFVGHDHHGWNKTVVNTTNEEVVILGPTSSAVDVAVANLELEYDRQSGKWKKSIEGELVTMVNVKADPNFMREFGDEMELVRDRVSKVIGELKTDVISREALFGPSAFVDLIHQVQLKLSDADISIAGVTAFDEKLIEGKVRYSDMFKLYLYENLLYKMKLSGAEIDALLEYSYGKWFNKLENGQSHLLRFSYSATGELETGRNGKPLVIPKFYNFDSAAGINYTVDLSQEEGNRVTIHSFVNGKKFKMADRYLVAINSYRGSGGGGHLTIASGIPQKELMERVVWVSEHDMRWYLTEWFEDQQSVYPVRLNNWNIEPAELYRDAMNRDYLLLFGD